MSDRLLVSTLYLRTTDAHGRATITEHQCWDTEAFIAARHQDCWNANDNLAVQTKGKQQGQAKIEVITQQQYRDAV